MNTNATTTRPAHARLRLLTLTLTLASGTALAQSQPDPSQPQEAAPGSAQQVQEAMAILPRVGTEQTPVMPTLPAASNAIQPGLSEGEDWLKVLNETLQVQTQPTTLAEGAFLLRRLGDLVEGPGGLLIFVPDAETKELGEGPVLIMPSRTLQRLQHEWTAQRVIVSGEIFSYHDRNQLLLTDYQIIIEKPADEQPKTQPETQPKPAPDAEDDPSGALEDDPDVRALLEELAQEGETEIDTQKSLHEQLDSTLSQTTRRTPVEIADHSKLGLEEGTLILRRPARMVRNPQGAWTLVFDNDDPESPGAIALVVLPCRALMRMERTAMLQGDAAQMLVSGRVYTHMGEHYLLPTLVQQVRPGEISSLQ